MICGRNRRTARFTARLKARRKPGKARAASGERSVPWWRLPV
jgi:hypothetical protein